MKVIFLDIDGVMNSRVFYEEKEKSRKLTIEYWWRKLTIFSKKLFRVKPKYVSLADWKPSKKSYEFDFQFKRLKEETCTQKWQWLSSFCNENDYKICISSVWKNHFGDAECVLPDRWELALTKLGFKPGTFVGITGRRMKCRGEEIKEWLDNHPEVEDYAILDDDSDMLPNQMSKYHQCDPWFGMSPNHLYRIKRKFKAYESNQSR
jgi:hypothetical protein